MRREYTDMRLMNAAVSAVMPAYDSKDATVSDIASAKAALANGFGQAIKAYASTQTPVELTSWLADTDGDRDEEGVNGWTRSGKAANYSLVIGANADSEEYAGKAIEYWQQWAEWNWIHMYQVVGMPLPEGTYTLSTIGRSYYDGKGKGTHGGVHAFAYKGALSKFETMTESDFLSLTANAYSKNFKQESLGFTLSEQSEVTVGLWGDGMNTYNWDDSDDMMMYSLTGMLTQSPANSVYIVKRKNGKVIKKLKMKK